MIEINLTPEQLAALGLPADQPVTAEAFLAALDTLIAKACSADALTTQAGDAATQLESTKAELDKVRADMETLYQKSQDLEKAQRDAGNEAILEQYAPQLKDPKMKDRLRALLGTDRESAMDILKGLPTGGAEAAKNPPEPVHNPTAGGGEGMTPEEKATKGNDLIKAVQKEGKFKTYNAAREEARRRQPELFS